jgi:predicted secreted protein
MKKLGPIVFSLLFCSTCLYAAPAASSSQSMKLTSQPNQSVQANGILTKKQPIYSLRLNSNPTTGYSWLLVSYPRKLVKVLSQQYVAPKKMTPGAGGYEVWQFKARKEALAFPRVIQIKMIYARPWEVSNLDTAQTFYVVTK